jgi:ribosomal-protein-alanine N-acetyltransferase
VCELANRRQFELREFEPHDFEALWQLDQICFTRGIAYSKAELAHYIKQPRAFTVVAERSGALAGFIVVEREIKGKARIITIDVHPEQRRAGLGSILMDAAETRLAQAKAKSIILEVAVDNHPAIAFYKKRGYSIVGTIPRYYLGSLDAFRMEKEL